NANNTLTVNDQQNGQIANNLDLNALSGNATVSQNTTGGNATSGNAEAVANVVNMLNSYIGAKQSFVGVVNVFGNLSGNILMPQEFLDQLIASNAPNTTVDLSSTVNTDLNANVTN